MTSTTLIILQIVFSLACFLLPAKDIIFNNRYRGFKRITKTGQWMFFVGLCMSILSFALNNKNISEKKADQKELSDTLYNRFKTALSVSYPQLKYDSIENKIINISNSYNSLVTMTNGNFVNFSLSNIGQNSYSVNEGVGVDSFNIEQSNYFIQRLKEHINSYNFSSNEVYLYSIEKTNGANRFPYIVKSLNRNGFVAIVEIDQAKLIKYSSLKDGLIFTNHNGKACLLVGNL